MHKTTVNKRERLVADLMESVDALPKRLQRHEDYSQPIRSDLLIILKNEGEVNQIKDLMLKKPWYYVSGIHPKDLAPVLNNIAIKFFFIRLYVKDFGKDKKPVISTPHWQKPLQPSNHLERSMVMTKSTIEKIDQKCKAHKIKVLSLPEFLELID